MTRAAHLMIGGPINGTVVELDTMWRVPILPELPAAFLGDAEYPTSTRDMRTVDYYPHRLHAGNRQLYRVASPSLTPPDTLTTALALLAMSPENLDRVRVPRPADQRWYVSCGCDSHGDHLGCTPGCIALGGCRHVLGVDYSAATEAEADSHRHTFRCSVRTENDPIQSGTTDRTENGA